MTSNAELIERLRRQAQQTSDIHREMAEAKSLRQEGNAERRTDLYMWPTPEQTVEGQAASTITALEERIERLNARYQWLANAVLACDYGDNEQGGADSPDRIGWCIGLTRRNAEPFIFGQSIDAAIDAALNRSNDDYCGIVVVDDGEEDGE